MLGACAYVVQSEFVVEIVYSATRCEDWLLRTEPPVVRPVTAD